MSGLPFIVVLGILILFFGVLLVLQASGNRRQDQPVGIEEFANAREALDTVFAESAAIERIFSTEDKEFIARSGTPEVQRLFLKERKTLAIQWLRKTQKQVAQLMDLHLRLAGYTGKPSPKFELKLAGEYAAFFVVSHILLLLLWLRGPFEARGIVGYTSDVAGRFCSVFSIRLKNVSTQQES